MTALVSTEWIGRTGCLGDPDSVNGRQVNHQRQGAREVVQRGQAVVGGDVTPGSLLASAAGSHRHGLSSRGVMVRRAPRSAPV